MAEGFFLSVEDRNLLRRLLDKEKSNNSGGGGGHTPPLSGDDYFPSEVYIALAPAGGISARVLTVPGSAECTIYRISNGMLEEDASQNRLVYNISTAAISAGQYVVVKRDKSGSWIAGVGTGPAIQDSTLIPVVTDICANGLARKRVIRVLEVIGDEYCAPIVDCCQYPAGTGTTSTECCPGMPSTLYFHMTSPVTCCITLNAVYDPYSNSMVWANFVPGPGSRDTSLDYLPILGECRRFYVQLTCFDDMWSFLYCLIDYAESCGVGSTSNESINWPYGTGYWLTSSGLPDGSTFTGVCDPYEVVISHNKDYYPEGSSVPSGAVPITITGTINETACDPLDECQDFACGGSTGTGTSGGSTLVDCCEVPVPNKLYLTITSGCGGSTDTFELNYGNSGLGFGWLSDNIPAGPDTMNFILLCEPTGWRVMIYCTGVMQHSSVNESLIDSCDPFLWSTTMTAPPHSGCCPGLSMTVTITE